MKSHTSDQNFSLFLIDHFQRFLKFDLFLIKPLLSNWSQNFFNCEFFFKSTFADHNADCDFFVNFYLIKSKIKIFKLSMVSKKVSIYGSKAGNFLDNLVFSKFKIPTKKVKPIEYVMI